MKHLQKILFLIPLYFISCTTSQVEDDFPSKEEQSAIGFNAKVNSRALADINSVKTNGIKVWGGYEGGTEPVFNGTEIVFGTNNNYTTDKYWTYNTYNFYAVYPKGTTATYNVADSTFTISNYNVKNTEDLLCASATHTYPENGSTVSLSFKHLLTNISVSFQKAADNKVDSIIVTGVHLIGMNTQGNYTRTTSTEAWTDFQKPFYISVSDLSISVEDSLTLCASDMLVMPQPITENSVAFYITYTYKQGSSVVAQSKSLTTYLPADISVDNPTWVIGKKVNYIGTIHVDKYIEFSTPKVETWGSEQAGGTIIIK